MGTATGSRCLAGSYVGNPSISGVPEWALQRRDSRHRSHRSDTFNQGNLALADQIVATNFTNHDPAAPMPGTGLEGLKKHVTMYRTAFPDLQIPIDDITVEGNKVTVRWTARATHKGDLMGIPPTGKQMTVTGISVIRIAGGKIAEQWMNWDMLGMMRQLGAVPSVGQAAQTIQ